MGSDDDPFPLPRQRLGLGHKNLERLGTKSSTVQNARSIASGEPTIMARKSSKKADESAQSILRGRDTSSLYQLHALSDDRVNAVAGDGSGPSSLEQSNATKNLVPANISQSQNRVKSATGRIAFRQSSSHAPENLARKSGRTTFEDSASRRISSQSILQKGSHAPFRSAGSSSGTNAIAGPSRSSRNDSRGMELPTVHLTENLRHQGSLALSSPSLDCIQPNSKTVQNYGEVRPAGRPYVMTPSESVAFSVKSRPMKPHWQLDDEERAREQENIDRTDHADRDFIKRIGSARRAADTSQLQRLKDAPKHLQSYLGRNFTLRKQNEPDSGSDSDSPMEIDGQLPPPRQVVRLQQAGFKGARKREWPQPPFTDPDSSDEEASSDEVDELDSSDSSPAKEDQDESESVDDSDIEEIVITAQRQRSLSPAEIEILPGPPRPPSPLSISEGMMTAIAALSLSSVRMQSTKQLPFLRRNLRHGFRKRCQQLDVPTEPTSEQDTKLRVRYEYRSQVVKVRLHDWACPLCELHGLFPTREMLACHLNWDHQMAPTEWTQNRSGVWCLRLILTDPLTELEEDEHGVLPTGRPFSVATPSHVTRRQQATISSPLPSLTLSPPGSVSSSTQARPGNFALSLQANRKVYSRDSLAPSTPTSRDSRSMMTSTTPPPSSSRERSATTGTTTTTTTTSTQRPRDNRYPTPPPPNNPLGPAAQFPYLPAKSEYGGPDIHYSCRPGGECLYDLLNTLPLEPYGVLAWDILDREDEIYDSDNVKDEYKVMHALWGRWIVLNRNRFIKDYYKGTKAFIDFYWKMIHRAAGWDALRYWLLMLVVNRFITGAEVASLLKHYESLTGMDTWYK